MTGGELVVGALQELGVLAAGASLRAEDAQFGLGRLNGLLSGLKLKRFVMFYRPRTVKTLTSGVSSYSIGPGGDIDIERPLTVEQAGLVLDSAVAVPIEKVIDVLMPADWAEIKVKTLSSRLVQGIYYDHGWTTGLGRIYVYPVPNVGTTQLVLYAPQAAASSFADLTTDYTFPPGYDELFRYGLAVLLAVPYGRKLDADGVIITRYHELLTDLNIANLHPTELKFDPALSGTTVGTWDWRTGGFGR